MHGNSVISLRPAREVWLTVAAASNVDPQIVHGCVDWYLYHEATLAVRAQAVAVLPQPVAAPAPGDAPPV
jgi:hypothetical protein